MALLRHLMLDLETWGTRPGCAIRSIGAVAFDPETGELGDEFYATVTDKSCKKLKMHRDPGTEAWWAKQSEEAQKFENPQDITEVMSAFGTFVRGTARTQFVWSQGANFDEPIAQEAFRLCGLAAPWKFWDSRCTRTMYAFADFNARGVPREGTYHNALDDARHQVRCVHLAWVKAQGRIL